MHICRHFKTNNIAIYFYTASMHVTLLLIYVDLVKQLILLYIYTQYQYKIIFY